MTDSLNIDPADHQGLRVQTLGTFKVWYKNKEIDSSAWSREKALHLFQFLVTMRHRYLHKEQIIDRLWPERGYQEGDRDFKVVLHTLNKVLEPKRKPRAKPRFVKRYDLTYGLNLEEIWIDADAFEQLLSAGNQVLTQDRQAAIAYFQDALQLYHGDYLPERRFEDWASAERERLQVLALGLMTTLADLLVTDSPLESIRLTQQVLTIDPLWENAYRTQMRAYLAQGNRPMAIRVYQQCTDILDQELGIPPLPETDALFQHILNQNS
jgi:DNA-binding SARP family transcriptional activator